MTNRMLALILVSSAVVLSVQGQPVSRKAVTSKDLVLHIGVENPVAVAGAPIFLASVIQNVTAQDLELSELRAEPIFSVRVNDASGREVVKTEHYREAAERSISIRFTTVPANGIVADRLNLLDYCQCIEPGSYEVTLRRVLKSSKDADEIIMDSATFRIAPEGSGDLGTNPATSFVSGAALFPSEWPANIALPASAQRVDISLHEPALVPLKLRNTGSKPAQFETGEYAESGYRVAVRYPSGQIVQVGSPRDMVSFGEHFDVNLQPGAEAEETILLNRWVDFDQEGSYTVALFVPEALAPAVYEVFVRPRDPQLLQDTAVRMTSVLNGLKRSTAYTALALMRDEIAIGKIQEINDPYTMTEALAVMDTPESASALVRIARNAKGAPADYAQKRLGRMLNATHDPAVRQILESAQAAQ